MERTRSGLSDELFKAKHGMKLKYIECQREVKLKEQMKDKLEQCNQEINKLMQKDSDSNQQVIYCFMYDKQTKQTFFFCCFCNATCYLLV